jgi:Flp pilus assembly protein TadG
MSAFFRDERGATYVESLIALPIMFALFNALVLCGYLCAGKLIVQRAASAAARAAVVFLPDDPEYYERSDTKSGNKSASKEACVKHAARKVLMASPFFLTTDADLDVKIEGAKKEYAPTTVTVRAKYDCSSFLGAFLCRLVSGQANVVPLSAAATLAYQEGYIEK